MGSGIRKLIQIDEIDESDQVAMNSESVGGDVRVALSVLAAFLETLFTVPTEMETQYAAPTATGFTVTVTPTEEGNNVWVRIKPTAAYAAGTLVLPGSPIDTQEVLGTCTQAVTTFTVNGSGHTVNGAPTTLAANAFFRLRYDGVDLQWYRIS